MAERAQDQKVEAFSGPVDFIKAAGAEARRRGMTKSGFYRYCLAKELGYSEADARALSMFMPIARQNTEQAPALTHSGNRPAVSSSEPVTTEALEAHAAREAKKPSVIFGRKRKAG